MTIFVVDAPVAIDLATNGATIPAEHSLTAPIAGRVVELHASPNTQATKGSLLLRIEEIA